MGKWSHLADLADDFVVRKETTKTAAIAAHDLKLCPLVLDVLEHIPAAARVGPLIVDETAGRPYAEHAYAREWRAVARKAGIPDTVWNMDARAGGISEADDAGADLDMIRSAAGHTQASTTARMSAGRSANHALLRSCARRTGRRRNGA
jgi:integrase